MSEWNVLLVASLNRDVPFSDAECDAMGEEFRETTTFGREGGVNVFGFDTSVVISNPLVVPSDFIGGEAQFAGQLAIERIVRALRQANGTRLVRVLKIEIEEESSREV